VKHISPTSRPRLMIFIIAYFAEDTLRSVLDRVPRDLFDEYDCEIVIVDDASKDRTAAIGRAYQTQHRDIRIVVLRNHVNQGYGGNQKVGYQYAIEHDFDFVAMVHGDGQYAPEELPHLVAPVRDGKADAVFGSRMITRGGALKGGMPLYKFIGNRILTTIQNALLRSALSEFHSGYRVYRVDTLRRLPFRLNSNDFHFDTEIIIQLFDAKARIDELPIPTYYGDEISRVNGMKYAAHVVGATLKYTAHRAGLLYQRRFDTDTRTGSERYDLKLGYASSHTYALEAVRPGSGVLDLGAGPGAFARELLQRGCSVAVVDQHAPKDVPTGKIKVFAQDFDQPLNIDVRPYDYIMLLDVIEHLKDPEKFVGRLRQQFDYAPRTLVLTTPNIAFVAVRLMLLAGQFNYGKQGILDATHTRLFTFRSIRQLLEDSGFRIKTVRGVPAPIPKAIGDNVIARALLAANRALIMLSRTLFSYQIFIEAEATPDVDFVLRDTRLRALEHDSNAV
jgi:glycosyltransferase involved in cell wall biosynthesis